MGRATGRASVSEHILAVDPGEHTGLAWCSMDQVLGVDGSPVSGAAKRDERYFRLFEWGEIYGKKAESQVTKLANGIMRLNVRIIVCESSDYFLLKGGKPLGQSSLVPVKIAAALQGIVQVSKVPMVYVAQNPGQAKGVITDIVLEAYGFSVRGRGREMSNHEVDAIRHLLLFIRRMYSVKPMRELIAKELKG